MCVDVIDETSSSRKWCKKAQKELDKLNKDSNLTAGLEAELTLAVGARVMLRRNVDTKQSLVNGATGTVSSISSQKLMVKLDHIHNPCTIEMVRSKFLLAKSFFVYRKKFPVTVAYDVTIHKFQGLSLDCAIVDLSSNVFCAGVCTLEGFHLTAFDPKSITVNNSCLEEINKLCSCFRKDLPPYEISVDKKQPVKRQLMDACNEHNTAKKKPKVEVVAKAKKECVDAPKFIHIAKRLRLHPMIKTVKYWLLTDLLQHDTNGHTTDIIQWMKIGKDVHVNCWEFVNFSGKMVDQILF